MSCRRAGLWAVLAIVCALVAITASASSEGCLPHEALVALLHEGYGERPIGSGLSGSGRLIVVFARPDGRTWSLILRRPDGQSCLVAAGANWRSEAAVLPGDDA